VQSAAVEDFVTFQRFGKICQTAWGNSKRAWFKSQKSLYMNKQQIRIYARPPRRVPSAEAVSNPLAGVRLA
jgi:hypothetical protein